MNKIKLVLPQFILLFLTVICLMFDYYIMCCIIYTLLILFSSRQEEFKFWRYLNADEYLDELRNTVYLQHRVIINKKEWNSIKQRLRILYIAYGKNYIFSYLSNKFIYRKDNQYIIIRINGKKAEIISKKITNVDVTLDIGDIHNTKL